MKGAIIAIAAAGLLSACATTPPATTTAAMTAPSVDYSRWSCRKISAELALTQRAMVSVSRRERPAASQAQTAEAFLFPASLGAAPPAAGRGDLSDFLAQEKRRLRPNSGCQQLFFMNR